MDLADVPREELDRVLQQVYAKLVKIGGVVTEWWFCGRQTVSVSSTIATHYGSVW